MSQPDHLPPSNQNGAVPESPSDLDGPLGEIERAAAHEQTSIRLRHLRQETGDPADLERLSLRDQGVPLRVLPLSSDASVALLPAHHAHPPTYEVRTVLSPGAAYYVFEIDDRGRFLVGALPERDTAWGWVQSTDVAAIHGRLVLPSDQGGIAAHVVQNTPTGVTLLRTDGTREALSLDQAQDRLVYAYPRSEIMPALAHVVQVKALLENPGNPPAKKWTAIELLCRDETDLIDVVPLRRLLAAPRADGIIGEQQQTQLLRQARELLGDDIRRLRAAVADEVYLSPTPLIPRELDSTEERP